MAAQNGDGETSRTTIAGDRSVKVVSTSLTLLRLSLQLLVLGKFGQLNSYES
jgi:hypothetical protein